MMKTIKKTRIVMMEIINRDGEHEIVTVNTQDSVGVGIHTMLRTDDGVEVHNGQGFIWLYPWHRIYRVISKKYDAPIDAEEFTKAAKKAGYYFNG